MLKALILENFKAFGGRRVIPIRPITLIFGPNSAGKSAILQSLLMLKQTITDPDTGDVPIRLKGSLVDLGSFRDMVYRHDTDRVVEITPLLRVPWDTDITPTIEEIYYECAKEDPAFGLGVRLRATRGKSIARVKALPLYMNDASAPVATVTPSEVKSHRRQDLERLMPKVRAYTPSFPVIQKRHPFWSDEFQAFLVEAVPVYKAFVTDFANAARIYYDEAASSMKHNLERDSDLSTFQRLAGLDFATYLAEIQREERFRYLISRGLRVEEPPSYSYRESEFIDKTHAPEWEKSRVLRRAVIGHMDPDPLPSLADLALETSAALESMLEQLVYIGPLRERPERNYLFSGADPADVGSSGSKAGDLLINDPKLLDYVNQMLMLFGIGYRLNVQRFKGDRGVRSDVYALTLTDERSGVQLNLRDVGFGISQVLPVLVQSLISNGSVILIEQPELHLHPRLQAELADVFIRSAISPHFSSYANTFLIETHSEHLILRLMRRIRETSRGTLPEGIPGVRPEDVSIIYVQPTENGSIPLVMDLDEDGELLTAWPNGFFEEGFHERFA